MSFLYSVSRGRVIHEVLRVFMTVSRVTNLRPLSYLQAENSFLKWRPTNITVSIKLPFLSWQFPNATTEITRLTIAQATWQYCVLLQVALHQIFRLTMTVPTIRWKSVGHVAHQRLTQVGNLSVRLSKPPLPVRTGATAHSKEAVTGKLTGLYYPVVLQHKWCSSEYTLKRHLTQIVQHFSIFEPVRHQDV